MSPSREERIRDYRTGQMSDEDAAQFEHEILDDAELTREVASGLERFSTLDATAQSMAPTPEFWNDIEAKPGESVRRQLRTTERHQHFGKALRSGDERA